MLSNILVRTLVLRFRFKNISYPICEFKSIGCNPTMNEKVVILYVPIELTDIHPKRRLFSEFLPQNRCMASFRLFSQRGLEDGWI